MIRIIKEYKMIILIGFLYVNLHKQNLHLFIYLYLIIHYQMIHVVNLETIANISHIDPTNKTKINIPINHIVKTCPDHQHQQTNKQKK